MSIPDRISLDGGSVRSVASTTSMRPAVGGLSDNLANFSEPEVLTPPRHLKLEEFSFPR